MKDLLPINHYDLITNVVAPTISDCIAQDIAWLNDKNIELPISDYDQLTSTWRKLKDTGFWQYLVDSSNDALDKMKKVQGIPEGLTAELMANVLLEQQLPQAIKQRMSLIGNYLSALNFDCFGKHLFYFKKNLVERFAVTEMNAPAEFLRLPFKSCMFTFEGKTALDALYAIKNLKPVSYMGTISVYLTELPYKGVRKLHMNIIHSVGEDLLIGVKREFLIDPEWSIDQAIRTDWNQVYKDHPDWNNIGTATEILGAIQDELDIDYNDESNFYHAGRAFFRIVVNSILYLSSNERDVLDLISPVKGKLNKNTLTKAKHTKPAKVSGLDGAIVGKSFDVIKIDKTNISSSSKKQTNNDIQEQRVIMVRGHWKHQAHGEGRKLRKLIFIEPYQKGGDIGNLINKPYLVT